MRYEPARVRSIITAIVSLAAIWGFNISDFGDKAGGSWELLYALIPLVLGEIIRPSVTPAKAVVVAESKSGKHRTGAASILGEGKHVAVSTDAKLLDADDSDTDNYTDLG